MYDARHFWMYDVLKPMFWILVAFSHLGIFEFPRFSFFSYFTLCEARTSIIGFMIYLNAVLPFLLPFQLLPIPLLLLLLLLRGFRRAHLLHAFTFIDVCSFRLIHLSAGSGLPKRVILFWLIVGNRLSFNGRLSLVGCCFSLVGCRMAPPLASSSGARARADWWRFLYTYKKQMMMGNEWLGL